MLEKKITYFDTPGESNTAAVLRIAREHAEELGIGTIVVASTEGTTAVKACQVLEGKRIVAVSHHMGYRAPDELEWPVERLRQFDELGGVRLTGIHAFYGLGRAVARKWNTYLLEELVVATLRLFGEGMKVVCEIAVMAVDAGLVRTDEDIISIGGTHLGADTAVLLRPVNLFDFFDLRVKEILCKPRF